MQRIARLIGIGYLAICLAALAGTALVGPLGAPPPFPLPIGPSREPVTVVVWYGTEKRQWLEQATAQFAATSPRLGGRPIVVELRGIGSREMAERIAAQDWDGFAPPTVASPASSMWLDSIGGDLLDSADGGPRPLLLTPLVVAAWEQRGALIWPDGVETDFWRRLHDAIASPGGWSALGGSEAWGPVKFGHTSPLSSNSGAQALLLLAYGYHSKTSGLSVADVADPAFGRWLAEVEAGVSAFGDSTGDFMNDVVLSGPAKYDAIVTYENLAIQAQEAARTRHNQGLRVYYPPATLLSDHPYAILAGDWVGADQRDAARAFRDFLLSRPIQELALESGFRPADPAVEIDSTDPSNPFSRYRDAGIQTAFIQASAPPRDAASALLELWRTTVGR